ncbi:MAG TPA: hypothetical protein VIL63_05780, partial [Terriglobales bacterium]
ASDTAGSTKPTPATEIHPPVASQPVEKTVPINAIHGLTDNQPKPVTAAPASAALNAAAPVTIAFNLPTLPPIPDQARSAASTGEEPAPGDLVFASPTATQASISSDPQALPTSFDGVAKTEAVAPASAVANPIAAAPVATPSDQPSHNAVHLNAPPNLLSVVPAKVAVSEDENPTSLIPAVSLPLPKQGDLLAQPIPQVKPASAPDEESEPAPISPLDETDERTDSHS